MIRAAIRILEAVVFSLLPIIFVVVPLTYWWQNPHLTYVQVFAHWWWFYVIGVVSCLILALFVTVYYGHDN